MAEVGSVDGTGADDTDNSEKQATTQSNNSPARGDHSHSESGIDCDLVSPVKLGAIVIDGADAATSQCEGGAGEDAEAAEEGRDNGDNHLSLGFMKKDDSGIDVSRTPTSGKDSSILSDNNESLSDSGAGSRTNSVSEASMSKECSQKPSKGGCETIVTEIENMDTDEINQAGAQKDVTTAVSCSDDDKDSDDSENDSGQSSRVRKLRESIRRRLRDKRRRHFFLDSDDTDSDNDDNLSGSPSNQENVKIKDDSDEDNSDEDQPSSVKKTKSSNVKKKKPDSDSEEEEMVDMSKRPKQTWRALFDCRDREYGFNSRVPPASFREKVQGSLQMVQRFNLQYKMEYHEGCVNALHFNRIGTLLASGSDDLNIVLWNWIRNRPALVYDSGHRSNVFQAKFMPFSGDCHVVSCARDGQVRLAELSLTGVCKQTKKLAQHKGGAHKLALELDSPHVFLSCGEDAIVYQIDLREDKSNKLVLTKEGEKKVPLYSIHSNPANSMEFCVGGRDHYIRVYDKRKISNNEDNGLLKKFCPHHLVSSDMKANVTCAVYNYNGTEIVGSYNDEDIYLFNNSHSTGAEHIHRYKGHRNNATVKGINFYGPRSEFIVSGSDCGHIFLWGKESEQIVQFMEGDEGGVINVLEPHPFAPVLATSGLDHDVKVWAPTAEEPTQLDELRKTMKKNRKEREEELVNEPDMIDGQMLWYLMHHIRRAQRRADQDGTPADQASSSSDNSEYDTEDSEENAPYRMSCNPS
ncbi:DDB1- and CUL4-associated factor 8-like [Mizuhopecten yessoensis]|uniref:DDB1-and CUL4-associated factor 8 n=1 Tax=Mizuhopecten yessoensis TaxID=6573 RepID=A0A210QYI3_MIZYE|nr:DDB1- and CUL4-associated factor 8-like [Mizuhopecten yessoensis]OWF53833.1 DDB1- and CUL4-associated factor 8 [Mizuhopecten yessoensis]